MYVVNLPNNKSDEMRANTIKWDGMG